MLTREQISRDLLNLMLEGAGHNPEETLEVLYKCQESIPETKHALFKINGNGKTIEWYFEYNGQEETIKKDFPRLISEKTGKTAAYIFRYFQSPLEGYTPINEGLTIKFNKGSLDFYFLKPKEDSKSS